MNPRCRIGGFLGLFLLTSTSVWAQGLTDIEGIRVGHYTLSERATGCTVILAEAGAVASVDVRGGAPGTRETDLLRPENTVQEVHAIVLSGGSAFGLSAADGVVRYLEERGVGFEFGGVHVPIVSGAVIYDLNLGDGTIRPDESCGYEAARRATARLPAEGNVGVGAGATVGKLHGLRRAMKSGIGTASIEIDDGVTVAALVVVNAFGDVVDPSTGDVVAGVRTADGRALLDARRALRGDSVAGAIGGHTTLAVVATNVAFSKTEMHKVAQMAHDGLARTIYPVHTPVDGDAIFALATASSTAPSSVLVVGALAADVVAEAVLRAVRAAESLPNLPAARDIDRGSR